MTVENISRRRLLGAGAATLGAGAAGMAIGFGFGENADPSEPAAGTASTNTTGGTVAFLGRHQAGIATAQQDRLLFASFDLTTDDASALKQLLEDWTADAARLTRGLPVGPADSSPASPPNDTGEAAGLDPARLTLTFGIGPSVFESDGVDRFGLARRRPAELVDLPAFAGDNLDPASSGGDLAVQACGNDPQVLYHAIRNLTRRARGTAVLRWTQTGFGRTSATTSDQATPRNLMGFKDGTNNLRSDATDFDSQVWADGGTGQPWMAGGSYLVVRRIRIRIETWDRDRLDDQEATIGRTKAEGAPIGATREHDEIDLASKGTDGAPTIAEDAHVRLANQKANDIFILRRGYSFTDGVDPRTGQLDAGLFFLAYQADPRRQFIPLQEKLAGKDALNEYIQHVSSAVFAIPPGVEKPGDHLAQGLFA